MLRMTSSTFLIWGLCATAAGAQGDVNINVPFGDLNLSHAQDAGVLANRLRIAARQACLKANQEDLAENKIDQQAIQHCVDSAINIALERIESSFETNVRASLIDAKQITTVP